MKDAEGIQFLQWCLPRLGLQWSGFRKVRRQVYKRIGRRLEEVGLSTVGAYRSYLEAHEDEWRVLDALCWISISRFYRDRRVFEFVGREVLPRLAEMEVANGHDHLRCWSIGCASGEEPYTLAILWKLGVESRFPGLRCEIVATDVDPGAIQRAQRACYTRGSLKDLPAEALAKAFVEEGKEYRLRSEYREPVRFTVQDIRIAAPDGPFCLVLCRNVAFTYFDDPSRRQTLQAIWDRMELGGGLVLGSLELLPGGASGFQPWSERLRIFRRSGSGGE
jgi:chemotaxis protein methyltransferase CheR